MSERTDRDWAAIQAAEIAKARFSGTDIKPDYAAEWMQEIFDKLLEIKTTEVSHD